MRSARAASTQRSQQAAGADRRPLRLHALVLRRVLGRPGRDARGRRAHRGHQRAGRHAVGRQRGQRCHQRDHTFGRRNAEHFSVGKRRATERRRRLCGMAQRWARRAAFAATPSAWSCGTRRRPAVAGSTMPQSSRKWDFVRTGAGPATASRCTATPMTAAEGSRCLERSSPARTSRSATFRCPVPTWSASGSTTCSGADLALQAYYDRTTAPFRRPSPKRSRSSTYKCSTLPDRPRTPGVGRRVPLRPGSGHEQRVHRLPAAKLDQTWASLFAQDEIALRDDLRLTLGARSSTTTTRAPSSCPTVRLAWKMGTAPTAVGSGSRTVRAPSRLDRDTFVPGEPPFLLAWRARTCVSEIAKVLRARLPRAADAEHLAVRH